jgi:hypothetical protein
MNEQLFSYQVHEVYSDEDIKGTDNFTVGADTPFVGAIIGGIIGGIVGDVVVEVVT